jgi:hypothetical protein
LKLIIAVILSVITLGYMVPFSIALLRGTKNLAAIFLLNFFLGWSVIGWIVAVIWAITEKED